jgi:Lon protease-like protein
VIGRVTDIAPEPALELPAAHKPLATFLELLIERVGRESFPVDLALDDASWVGYRLAELLPLPLSIKQSMLEINDAEVRLSALAKFLKQQHLL